MGSLNSDLVDDAVNGLVSGQWTVTVYCRLTTLESCRNFSALWMFFHNPYGMLVAVLS